MSRTPLALCLSIVVAACASPSESASPTPVTSDQVIASFISESQAADRSFRMEMDADITAGGFGGQVVSTYEVEGEDFSATFTFGGTEYETLMVDGIGYTRSGDGPWSSGGSSEFPDPFAALKLADLEYVGLEEGLHHLRAADVLAALEQTSSGDLAAQADISSSSYDIYVDDAGIPAHAELALEGVLTGPPGGELSVRLEYVFSDWGEAFGIALPPELIPTPSPTPFVPPNGSIRDATLTGRIALSADWGGGNWALVVIEPDGSNGHAWAEPAGSPDKDYAFAAPAWSPDGRRLAFSHQLCPYPGQACVRVIAIMEETGTITDLTPPDPDAYDSNPTWSPDGSAIMFDTNRSTSPEDFAPSNLFVVAVDGSDLRRVETGLMTSQKPAWAPDGAHILFEGSDGADLEGLFLANPDGSGATLIADGHWSGRGHPAWSPDGTHIGWSRYSWTGSERLVVMNADGSDQVDLQDGSFRDWSPNGAVLLYQPRATGSGDEEVWIARVDGAGARALPLEQLPMSGFDWAPYP